LKVTWYQQRNDPEDPEPEACPICFCEYSPGVSIISLPCKHFFHKECIRRWLKRDACALCARRVWRHVGTSSSRWPSNNLQATLRQQHQLSPAAKLLEQHQIQQLQLLSH